MGVAKRFKGVKIDVVYSSRYERAIETAEAVNKVVHAARVKTDLLNEWRGPSELQGQEYDAKNQDIRNARLRHINEPKWHYSDEENFFDVRDRADRFLGQLSKKEHMSVVLVTHGGLIRVIMARAVFGKGVDGKAFRKLMELLNTCNTGITELERDKKGNWRLITFNDYAHLQ